LLFSRARRLKFTAETWRIFDETKDQPARAPVEARGGARALPSPCELAVIGTAATAAKPSLPGLNHAERY
jgi:hypothetical protein